MTCFARSTPMMLTSLMDASFPLVTTASSPWHIAMPPGGGIHPIKRDPLIRVVHRAPGASGSRVWDAGGGNDREDPQGVLSGQEADQADLPRVAGVAEDRAQGRAIGSNGVHLRA